MSESALGSRVALDPRTDVSRTTRAVPSTLLRRLLALVALANADGVPF